MKDQRNCPICNGSELDILHTVHLQDEFPIPETKVTLSNDYRRNYILFENILKRQTDILTVKFLICLQCGLIFFTPRPDESDLAIKYQSVSEQQDTIKREQLHRLVDIRAKRAKQIRKTLEPHWTKTTNRALDVGGADGHCLGELTADFECGILDFEDRSLWPQVNKWGNSLSDLETRDQFDVILTCHTLEHVPDPASFVAKITAHLSHEGILYIEVPYGCDGEIYRTHNFLTHINFFSEGSLGYLLEQAGLHVTSISSGAIMNLNKYSPAIGVIAKKDDNQRVSGNYLANGYRISKLQMTQPLNSAVRRANIQLVLSDPLRYGWALVRRYLKGRHSQS